MNEHTWLDVLSLVIGIISMGFISLTMLLRGNDFRRKNRAIEWHVAMRMMGFMLAGFSPYGVVTWWIFTGMWPSLFLTMFLAGVSFIFFTTPDLPPWHELLTKGSKGR